MDPPLGSVVPTTFADDPHFLGTTFRGWVSPSHVPDPKSDDPRFRVEVVHRIESIFGVSSVEESPDSPKSVP